MDKELICVKIEITTEELNKLRVFCRTNGLKFQWFLGQLVKNEIKRLQIEVDNQ